MSDGAPSTSDSQNQADESNPQSEAQSDPQSEAPVCRNCGASLGGEYCHECGTRRSHELRLRDLGGRFLRSVLDVDDYGAGLRQLFINGLKSPDTLARQYVEGTQERTVNPITYFLIISTVAFFVLGFFQAEWIQVQTEMMRTQWAAMGLSPDDIFGDTSPLRRVLGWTSAEDAAGATFAVLRQAQTYFGALNCLLVAGLLRWGFPKQSYADLVVFELYTVAQASLILLPLVPILMIWAPTAYFAVTLAVLFGVHAFAGPGFFGRTWKGWLLPPLGVGAALVGLGLISFAASFVAGIAWGLFAT